MKPRKADESRWMSFKNSGRPLSTVFLGTLILRHVSVWKGLVQFIFHGLDTSLTNTIIIEHVL